MLATETHTTTHKPRRHAAGARAASLQTLIQLAFDRCDGDRREAAQAVIEAAEGNASLAAHLIALGAKAAVGNLICSDRAKVKTGDAEADVTRPRVYMVAPTEESAAATRHRLAGRAARNLRMLMNWPLRSGKPLSGATRADVLAEASAYEPQARDMMTTVEWFRRIAAEVPDGKTVQDAVSNERLNQLMASARASWGANKEQAA